MYLFLDDAADNKIHLEFEIGTLGCMIAAVALGVGVGTYVFKERSFYHKKSLLEISIQIHIFYFVVSFVSLFLEFELIFSFALIGKDNVNLSLLLFGVFADLMLAGFFFLMISQSKENLKRFTPCFNNFSLELYIDFTSLHHKMSAVKLVSVLASFDSNLLIFLPFRRSEFSVRSFGYPTLWALKVILFEKILVSIVRIVASAMATTADLNSIGLFFISLLVLIVNICEAFMRLKAEDMIALDERTCEVVNQLYKTRSASIHNSIELGALTRKSDDVNVLDLMSDVCFRESFTSICDSLKEKNEAIRKSNLIRSSMRISDVENPVFTSSQKYADENLDIYKQQLKDAGLPIFEYMELNEIRREIKCISNLIAENKPFDDSRLDYLIGCMKLNKTYIKEQAEIRQEEDKKIHASLLEALQLVRSFIPPDIRHCTIFSLQARGYSEQLAKRLVTVKALWLTRYSTEHINSMHFALLKSDFGFDGRNLDLVELLALYACYPQNFTNDGNGKKQQYRDLLREKVQLLLSKEAGGVLNPKTKRHSAYRGQVPLYSDSDFVLVEHASASSRGAFEKNVHSFEEITALRGESTQKSSVLASLDMPDFSSTHKVHVADDNCSQMSTSDLSRNMFTEKLLNSSVHSDATIGQSEFHRRLRSLSNSFASHSAASRENSLVTKDGGKGSV